MNNKSRQKEIGECKEILKNPLLGYSQRASIESYVKSLEENNE